MQLEFGFEVVIFLFVLGTVVGSFLNVVVLRHIQGEGYAKGRSHCMSCKKVLDWYELVPVFSYLFQLGKCRGCKAKLSPQYPLVELGTGLLFVVVYLSSFTYLPGIALTEQGVKAGGTLALHLAIWSLFIVITVYDFRTKLIPDVFSFTLAGLAFLSMFIDGSAFVLPNMWQLLAGPLLFLPFYVLWKVSDGRWLGLGDGKLALGIGWFLGLSLGGTAILFAFWIGAGVSLLILAWQKISRHFSKTMQSKTTTEQTLTMKSEIPFGPFLVLGTLIVYILHFNLFTYLL